MHSKWQLWDYFASAPKDTLGSIEGILALNSFGPTCLKLLKDHLMRGAGNRIIHYKMADEVTKGWIEEEFQTLSLFGNSESFFIHEAQELNAELFDLILKLDLQGRALILSFETEAGGWKKVLKSQSAHSITIEEPKFRDFHKLLDFVSSYLRLPLSYEAKAWLLESIESDLGTFYNSCCLIKLNHPENKEVSLSDVQKLLTIEKLDQFALASLFARKKSKQFFEKICELDVDFDRMRSFFGFLQGHIIKMMDPSYSSRRSYTTHYDKEIQSASKLWNTADLKAELERFNRWELMCKKKDFLLWHELRQAELRQ
jgi:hypothetical protein